MNTLMTLITTILLPLAVEQPDTALYDLTHIATIESPEVDGETLQACSVEIEGSEAIVAYNMQGENFKGGVDVFNIKSIDRASQVSRYLFNDSKVNHASLIKGGTLVCALTCMDPELPCAAALQTINTSNDAQKTLLLSSSACTNFFIDSNNRYFALSAAQGALHMIQSSPNLSKLASLPFDDARWVEKKEGQKNLLYVLQGRPGRLSEVEVTDYALKLRRIIPVKGVDVPEGKSSFALSGDLAFIAAGRAGVQIINTRSGRTNCSIPISFIDDVEVDHEDQVTTAVAIEDELILVANGGAGISLYESKKKFKDVDVDEELKLQFAGRYIISGGSANHIAYKKGYLLVASGKQGVQIIKVDKKKQERKHPSRPRHR